MPIPFEFNFKNPDYGMVFQWRAERLAWLLKNPDRISDIKKFYRQNIAQFIIDWGITHDPRNIERGLSSYVPFLLFPKQEEWVNWFIDRWRNREPGLTDKSREMGISWLTIAVSVSLCLFNDGLVVGFGSRKEVYVDKIGHPNSLLDKARKFTDGLPAIFKGNWDIDKHAPFMRIEYPDTNSLIMGEGGDNIGRGARASFYIVDEAAWLPRPELVEASLSETTNCRIDISTPRGMNNPFARKRFSGNTSVFSLHWKDDPRKDQSWYDKKCKDIDDPVVIAQEIDLNYSASIEGILIPSAWVQASIDAHLKLQIPVTGIRKAGVDIADEGSDKNAYCGRYGILVEYLESWSGKNSDIYHTVEKIFQLCDKYDYNEIEFDSDGLGAGVRGDARVINETRHRNRQRRISFNPFRGSGAVIEPNGDPFKGSSELRAPGKGRTNEDFFANAKAQSWWALRKRFQMTYRAVVEKLPFDQNDIISISSRLPEYQKLMIELSQPTYSQNNVGKIVIDKMPDGSRSPNLADSVMIAFAPVKTSKGFWSA